MRAADRPGKARMGEVAEWLKAPVLKTGVAATSPWVRIPPSPPVKVADAQGTGRRLGGRAVRLEVHGHAIDAIPQICRRRTVVENMAEMAAAV